MSRELPPIQFGSESTEYREASQFAHQLKRELASRSIVMPVLDPMARGGDQSLRSPVESGDMGVYSLARSVDALEDATHPSTCTRQEVFEPW